jgi:hypothetical protein
MFNSPTVGRPSAHRLPTFPWWTVLCLVGLDYFSSLAYLPTLAVHAVNALAPMAAIAVAIITLVAAVPVYFYVVGRSPHGEGGTGLLDHNLHGWVGKCLILFVLGFVATDFVVTRTLSVSDASSHILHNPYWQEHSAWVIKNKEMVREALPGFLQGRFFDFWNEQLVLTVLLSILAFGLYFYLVNRLTHGFLSIAVMVVGLYLTLTVLILVSSLVYISQNPEVVAAWQRRVAEASYQEATFQDWLWLALAAFPPMAIGLSGFELSMASAPLVAGRSGEDPANPRSRIFRTRLVMGLAAVLMCTLVIASVYCVTLLVPAAEVPHHRALAYLANGDQLANGTMASEINPLFGPWFGTFYTLVTVVILCLAGATATITLRDMVPNFLARFGMQMEWALRVGLIIHLFNVVILVVTLAFQASVLAQQGAYATSVIALLLTASFAAYLDVRHRWRPAAVRWLVSLPFGLVALLFAVMGALIVYQNTSGVAIALAFVAVVFTMALLSRWLRSTEMRFQGFSFADEASKQRWAQMCQLDFQVLVPHKPGHHSLSEKENKIRKDHRLALEVPMIFVEVELGDPSDFYQMPLMEISKVDDREVIRVTRCTSVAHVLAAIALAWREVGQPPEVHFAWSTKSAHSANIGFLLFGQGNIPWLVHELIRKGERERSRQPRVIVG